jgi:hypothetical protein
MVVVEAWLVDCRPGEGYVSRFVQQIASIF